MSTHNFPTLVANGYSDSSNAKPHVEELLDLQTELMTVLIGRLASVTEDDEHEQVRELAEQLENVGMIDASLLNGNAELIESSCDCHDSIHKSIDTSTNTNEDSENTVSVNIDPTAPSEMLEDAAAQAAAEDSDDAPSSSTLVEYRECQANAEDEDAANTDGKPSTLADWKRTEDGKRALEEKESRLSLGDLLRAPRLRSISGDVDGDGNE